MSVGPDRAGAAFDGYVIVDWSAASVRRTGKDSIWIAALTGDDLRLEHPATREAAMQILQDLLTRATDQGQRLLVGFDFAFGFCTVDFKLMGNFRKCFQPVVFSH